MKRKLLGAVLAAVILLIGGCAAGRDTTAQGTLYVATKYQEAGKTVKITPDMGISVELFITRDGQSGVLTMTSAKQATYTRRYEAVKVTTKGDTHTLKSTGEVAAVQYGTQEDLDNNVNAKGYSYTAPTKETTTLGDYTEKPHATLAVTLGKTRWSFDRKEAKATYTLPYGVATQAKQTGVDQQ